ncbi:hypothetical protein [Cognaticolwellia mytili]|uniref:hypothetical protein n=1 Tax=Cognaticolwellia mytili TaxID=1888913 RepID=UPI00117DD5EF|nr:hypothetical protein [Cognaticolwellia mytili]
MTVTNQPDSFLINVRYCRAAWGIVHENSQALGHQYLPASIEQFKSRIESARLSPYKKENRDKNYFYGKLKNKCDYNLITEDKLSWVNENNHRACYFVYQKLTQTMIEVNRLYLPSQASNYRSTTAEDIWIEKDATSLVGKINAINISIDTMNLRKECKEYYIERLKKQYSATVATDDFEWAIPNEALHKWLYCYMKDKFPSKNINFTTDSLIENYLYSAIELYDDWEPMDKLEKGLFLEKLKKAYRQKSYRQNKKESKKEKEKTYTYSMPLNIEDKMTEISRQLGVTRNKVLTDLINEKHNALDLGD